MRVAFDWLPACRDSAEGRRAVPGSAIPLPRCPGCSFFQFHPAGSRENLCSTFGRAYSCTVLVNYLQSSYIECGKDGRTSLSCAFPPTDQIRLPKVVLP